MAGTIQGLSIGLSLETAGIERSLKALKGQLKGVDAEMKANMSAFSRSEKSVEKYETRLGGMNKKLDATKAAVNAARREHERMVELHGEGSRQAQASGAAYNNLAADFNNLERQIGEVTEEFQQFQREQEVAQSSFGRLSTSLETVGASLSAVGDKMKDVGKKMSMFVTAPLVGFGIAAAKTGIDFDDSMAKVQAVSGATGDELGTLRDLAKDMGRTTKFSASEAADGLNFMAMAGWKTEQMVEGLPGILSLAAASGEDLATTSDIVTDALTAFGMGAEDSGKFADILAAASSNANTNVSMLGESFKYVAPLAGAMNYSAEDVSVALGLMANSGIKASQAGTSLKTMMANMAKPTKAMSNSMEELGISLTDSDGKMKTFDEVMLNLRDSFSGLSETQQASHAATIFGKEAMAGSLSVINASEADYNKLTDAIGNSAGKAEEMAAVMEGKLGGVLREIKSGIEGFSISIYEIMEPALSKAAVKIKEFVQWLNQLSPAAKVTGVVIAAIAAAIGPVLVVMGTLISMLGGVMTALAPLALKIAQAGGLFKYLRIALMAFTGPVAIAVGIIAGLTIGFIALYKNSETFREGVQALIAKVKELASQALAALKPAIAAVVGFFKDQLATIKQFWDENSATILAALSNIGGFISTVFNGILKVIQFVMPAVLALISAVWGNIKGVISGALDVIMGAVKVFSGLFSGDFAKMWEGLKQIFFGAITFLWNFISLTFFGKILGGARAFVGMFKGFFTGMWATLKTMFSGALNGLKTNITSSWTTIWNTTTRIFGLIWNTIRNIFTTILTGISNAVLAIYTRVVTQWTSIFSRTTSIFNSVWNFLRNIFTTIRNYISTAVGNILSKVTGTWNTLKSKTSEIFGGIFNAVKGKFDDIVNAAKNLPKRIGDGIGSMATKVKDGVNRVVNNLASTLGKGVNGVIGGINWVLGKIGVEKDIPKWDVPQYAHGTHGHPGGMAILGDGRGSNAGRELIKTPSGELGLSPATDTLMNLPKGTQVLSAKKTRELLGEIPKYKNGVGEFFSDAWKGTKNLAGKAWEGTKNLGGKAKDIAENIWDHVSNPGKLLETALSLLGVKKPESGSFVGDMARGGYNKIKDSAAGFLKKQIDNSGTMAGSGHGFGSKFRLTSRRGFRINPVTGIGQMHQGDDWGAPMGTLIPAQAAGKVIQSGFHAIRGNFVRIQSGIMDRLYQHNQRNMVKVGQNVRKGQAVGTVGSTGRSTGPHLHYEVRKNGVNINPNGLETGGIVNKEQFVRVGEKNREEVVIPMHPSRRTDAMKLLALAGKKLSGGSDKGITRPNQLPNAGGGSNNDGVLKQLLAATMKQNEILMKLLNKDNNLYVDGDALAGAIGDPIDSRLGNSSRNNMYMNGVR